MGSSIRNVFLVVVFVTLADLIVGAKPILDPEEIEALLNSEDYEEDAEFIPEYIWKRGGFWASHPSDFSPMRRPPTVPSGSSRSTKRSEDSPYHPLPRSVNISQKNLRSQQHAATNEDMEALLQSLRDKRQSPGSFLLMKLGRMKNGQADPATRGRRRA